MPRPFSLHSIAPRVVMRLAVALLLLSLSLSLAGHAIAQATTAAASTTPSASRAGSVSDSAISRSFVNDASSMNPPL